MINEKSAITVPAEVRAAWEAIEESVPKDDLVLLNHVAFVRAWLNGEPLPAPDPDLNRIAPVRASVPVVYAWTMGAFGGSDESWVAVCEDGELMASHVSSNRAYGQLDVHLNFGRVVDRYRAKFGGLGNEFYLFVVVPEGKRPPAEVMAANQAWAERVDAAAEPTL